MSANYTPRSGAGTYGVLVALYFDEISGREYWTKEEVCNLTYPKWTNTEMIGKPTKHKAGASFHAAKKDYYDGWSSVQATLIKKHGLLEVINRKPKEDIMKKMYKLTENGRATAKKLVERDDLEATGPVNVPVAPPPIRPPQPMVSSAALSVSSSSSSSSGARGGSSSSFETRINSSSKAPVLVDLTSDNEDEMKEMKEVEEETSPSLPPLKKQKATFVGKKGMMVFGNPWAETETLDWIHCGSPPLWYGKHSAYSSSSSSSSMASSGQNLLFEEFDLLLLVDKRELKHIKRDLDSKKDAYCNAMLKSGVTMDVKEQSLKVGDYMWVLRHKLTKNELVLDYIMERKSYTDLWGSVTKGSGSTVRWYEQKRRMIYTAISNRYYLVEGLENDIVENSHTMKPAEQKMSTIMGCKVQSQLDGFHLLYTSDVNDTTNKLLSFTRQLGLSLMRLPVSEWMNNPAYKKIDFQELQEKASVLKRSVKQLSESMLYQVTSIGKVTAEQIFAKYGSIAELMDALEHGGDSVQSRSEFLSKNTGLSKEKAKKVVQILTTEF